MRASLVDSVFDVAEWFLDTALNDGDALSPVRLQHLMFLAQGYYSALTKGERLMPCFFIADERGPLEPNSFRIYNNARRPNITISSLPETAENLLDAVWRKFGAYSADFLSRMVLQHDPYIQAMANGKKTEISLKSMADFYGHGGGSKQTPSAEAFEKPRIMRSQSGKTVTVTKWMPKKK